MLHQVATIKLLLLLLFVTTTTTKTTTTTTTTTTTPTPTEDCPADTTTNTTTTTHETIKMGVTELGMKLLRELGVQRNTVISPYSLWSAGVMVLVGAEGQTGKEIAGVLGVEGKEGVLPVWRGVEERLKTEAGQDAGVSVNVANRIYISKDTQIKKCRNSLAAILLETPLDQPAEAAQAINNVVNATTEGKIPQIINPSLLIDAKMVIINAVYFKGTWQHRFNQSETRLRPFYTTPEAAGVNVTMMRGNDVTVMIGLSDALQATIIQLPYTGDHFKMTIILPTVKGEAGFKTTLNALNASTFWAAVSSLTLDAVDIEMPKFDIKAKFGDDLKLALQNLGMNTAFTFGADLSSFGSDLFVKHILHRTFLSVDEEGSEAAGATGVIISTKISGFLNINRPFLFGIHSNDVLLYIGAYVRP